jgi:hypothetical protein
MPLLLRGPGRSLKAKNAPRRADNGTFASGAVDALAREMAETEIATR